MARQLPKQLLRMVETLDEEQLHALYHVVAQRLQLAQKAHALAAMSQFHVLDRVSFVHHGKPYEGTVTRLNQKTVGILLENGTRWNVAPSLLTKVADRQETGLQLLREVESGQ
jgi:metal-dependent HD superfamily phosphatase/phosphodiesterase